MKRVILFMVVTFLFVFSKGSFASSIDLDLTSFATDTGVSISNGVVRFTENEAVAIYAYNDVFYVPANATSLSYNYSFALGGQGSLDYLVTQLNYTTYVMAIDYSGSGSFTIDLTPYQGQTISLAFGLESDSYDDKTLISIAQISNVKMETTPVPLPTSFLLLGSGLLGVVGIRKKK